MAEIKKIGLFIPTLNAGQFFENVLNSISIQKIDFQIEKLIIDSGSVDKTVNLAVEYGFKVVEINKSEFNHGATRNMAVEILNDCEFVVMMTQDVVLADSDSINNLIMAMIDNENIFMAYGRQIADELNGSWFEKRARQFNYPSQSKIKNKSHIEELGIKTAFASNAFSAYNTGKFKRLGGFPASLNFSEDMYIAAKAILKGYNIFYESKAIVFHTHNYSLKEEFLRYVEIGKFHKSQRWIQDEFGKNEKEGIKSVLNETNQLIKEKKFHLIIKLFLLNVVKYLGYKKGLLYK
ncbi:glycosyltransferase family 2 protein [Exiguobacterium sp. ZOR0005]|uniref:glycosyltransferase family 2 protein n=1 Tax=Exiguobacterium sp. ZOR0005 TaxID=1339226 RepID=UPI00068B331D|nr:glycosyltransferase [Exiguobacterium sp. ZOR0005]